MRRIILLCLCLSVASCTGVRAWRDSPVSRDSGMANPADSLTSRRLAGQEPSAPPLLPQPGDIWADVIAPSQVSQTSAPRAKSRSAAAPAAGGPESPAPSAAKQLAGEGGARISVQLAAAESEAAARAAWRQLQARLPRLMDGRTPSIASARVAGRTVWRLRTAGFTTPEQARDFCARMAEAHLPCWVSSATPRT